MSRHNRRALPVSNCRDRRTSLAVSPEEVLAWARSCEALAIKFIGLVTYFCTVRGSESLHLSASSFAFGLDASRLECSRIMNDAGLYGGLAVRINAGPESWVSCFNEEAADQIRALTLNPELWAALARIRPNRLSQEWATHGVPGVSMADLRIASIHWLVAYQKLHIVYVAKHSRSKSINSVTRAYHLVEAGTNRPDEIIPFTGLLDLDS